MKKEGKNFTEMTFPFFWKTENNIFCSDHAAQVSREHFTSRNAAGCGETSTYRISPPPDSARHLGGVGSDGGEEFPRVRRKSRYVARRWVIHRAYPARITPGFHFRAILAELIQRGSAYTKSTNFRKDVPNKENVLTALKRRVKKSSSLKDLYFHPLYLTQPVVLLSPSLYRKCSQITIVIF